MDYNRDKNPGGIGPSEGALSKAMLLLSDRAREDDDPLMRKHAVYLLGLTGNEEYIPLLVSAIRDPEKAVRGQAVQALAQAGKPSFEYVLPLLQDPDWRVRYRAAEVLGLIGDSRGVEPLIGALSDPRDHVRYMAAKSLGIIGDPSARKPLEECLSDENSFVRSMAGSALSKIGA